MKKRIPLIVMCVIYMLAGVNHFLNTGFYLKIMPPYIPYPLFLVYLSGVIEFILGALALTEKFKKPAGWLLIAMLIAFLPVHIQMIIDYRHQFGIMLIIALIRLPLQFLLIYWVYKLCWLGPKKQKVNKL